MKNKSYNYKSLTKKGLLFLKDKYVSEKVNAMTFKELKNFVFENISHQIKDTIGDEEENEAWEEMENYFNDDFKAKIEEIQNQFPKDELLNSCNQETDYEKRQRMLKIAEEEKDRIDMWED